MINRDYLRVILGCLLVHSGFSACCGGPLSTSTASNESNMSMPKSSMEKDMNTSKSTSSQQVDMKNLDLKGIMNKCNETSKVSMEYLKELNDTGSFPDETDKNSMCFIKCYLENVGILSTNNTVDKDKAIDMLWTSAEETVDDCVKEMMGDDCEKAYFLARCVMTRALVEKNNEDVMKQS